MPAFKNHSQMIASFGTDQLRALKLRLPNAFDQWSVAHQELRQANPDMPELSAATDSISIVVSEQGALGYLCRKGKTWYTVATAEQPRPSPNFMIASAIGKANRGT